MEKDIKNDNGLNEIYYPSGKIKERFYKQKGVKEGYSTLWHENGTLHIEGNYKNGIPNGKIKEYDKSGQLKLEWNYIRIEPYVLKKYNESDTLEKQLLKHKTIKLTQDIFEKLTIHNIIYAETTNLAGLDNIGDTFLYLIKDKKLICYVTNESEDENLTIRLRKKLFINANFCGRVKGEHIFNYYYGGGSNHVLINKNVFFKKGDSFYVYSLDNKDYKIPTTKRLFNRIVRQIEKFASK